MQAIILAAGVSTRTYPLTANKPKTLLPLLDKTILEHSLEQLNGLVYEVIIIIGYKAELIKKVFKDTYKNIKITYVEQKQPLGTAYAVLQTEKNIKNKFMIILGDDINSKTDLNNLLKHKYCILAKEVLDPRRFGVLEIRENRIINIKEKPEKPKTNLVNTGIWIMDKKIFEIIKKLKKSTRGEYEITDALKELIKTQEVNVEIVKDYWIPISYPWDLLDANAFFLDQIKESEISAKLEREVTIKNKVIIKKGTIVKSGSYIEGPVFIGKNCTIGPNCYIRPKTVIQDNCRISQASEIENSIIMKNTEVAHFSYISDSVIGENVDIGARTIIANLRCDIKNVKSVIKDKLMDSGRKKLGAIIGDNVKTGINTLIFPGIKIWPNKTTNPGEIVNKDIK